MPQHGQSEGHINFAQIVWKSSFQNFHFREVPKNKEDSWPSNPHLVSVEVYDHRDSKKQQNSMVFQEEMVTGSHQSFFRPIWDQLCPDRTGS